MEKKKFKYIYGLVCNGHYDINALFSTKRRAMKEGKYSYHKNCKIQVVEIRLD